MLDKSAPTVVIVTSYEENIIYVYVYVKGFVLVITNKSTKLGESGPLDKGTLEILSAAKDLLWTDGQSPGLFSNGCAEVLIDLCIYISYNTERNNYKLKQVFRRVHAYS